MAASDASSCGPRYLKVVALQFRALMVKNFWLQIRSWKLTLVQIFSPLVFVIILYILQQLYIFTAGNFARHPPVEALPNLKKCITGSSSTPCITISYAPAGNPEIDAIMSIVARRQGLTIQTNAIMQPDADGNYKNGQEYPSKGLSDIVPIQNSTVLTNFVLKYQNVTGVALAFTAASTWSVSPVLPYSIYYNTTTGNGDVATPMIKALDEAILERYGDKNNTDGVTIGVRVKGFPKVVPSLSASSVIGTMGALWFYCPPLFNFMILLNQIVTENELKLRLSMRTMGLKNSVYWTTWFLTNTIINVLSSLVLIGFGAAFQFAFFLNTNFLVLFLLFFLFTTSMVPLAFLLSAFIKQAKTAATVAFIVFVAGLLLQIMFTSFPIYYWYLDSTPRILKTIFPFYAPFNFAKLFADINTLTQPQLNLDGSSNDATGYPIQQLFKPFTVSSLNIESPAGASSLGMFILITVLLLLLAWYVDNVIPMPRRPVWFPFQPAYWGLTCLQEEDPEPVITRVSEEQRSQMSPDAQQEMEAAIHKPLKDGLRIVNINKRFTSYWSYMLNLITRGKVRDRSFQAVANLFLTVPSGQCLALLGHNGAGKTTLVNMLTGLFSPTSGDAIVFGQSLRGQNGMDKIRSNLGVCPQHDILFPELTAKQHLELFADIKGLPLKGRKEVVLRKLAQVNLSDVANVQAGRFSGGMKRRLSLAVSCIGEPGILFLDEPTTGLDPINKREVWDLIKEMKQECIVILTTHSMAECEYLSDRVAIMAHGRIRCLGDALNLKNRFGSGYRVSVFVEDAGLIDKVKQVIQEDLSPSDISLCAQNSNYLQFSVSVTAMKSVVFKIESGAVPSVKDWSLSGTSLEDVFLDITSSADKPRPDAVQQANITSPASPANTVEETITPHSVHQDDQN